MIRNLLTLSALLLVACGDKEDGEDTAPHEDPFVDEDGDGISADADCDDADAELGAAWSGYTDADGDGYGAADGLTETCDTALVLVPNGLDCDDTDAAINPGAEEVCDGIDNDCNGYDDGPDSIPFYLDADGDGFGGTFSVYACEPPDGFVETSDDCDDGDAMVNPEGVEVCDGVDNDCDTLVDDDDEGITDQITWTQDLDGDGYGGSLEGWPTVVSCVQPEGYVDNQLDCEDRDDSQPTTWYADADGDGHGDPLASVFGCIADYDGYLDTADDCDDSNEHVNPGEQEICDEDNVDEDCDGSSDDADSDVIGQTTWYVDGDGDGFGDGTAASTSSCDQPSGYADVAGDCDDGDTSITGGGVEVCDGVDNDCDGVVDWGLTVPGDYSTISDAVSAASSGDTVCIAAGDYAETVDLGGKSVNLVGEGSTTTTVDGSSSGPVVLMDRGASGTISGITITGGSASAGAGMYIGGGDVVLEDVVITDNECTDSNGKCYGILYVDSANLSMSDVEISDSYLAPSSSSSSNYMYGGAIYSAYSDITWDTGSLTGTVAEDGPYTYAYLYGTAIYSLQSHLWMTGVDVTENFAENDATYAYNYGLIYSLASEVAFEDSTVSGNGLYSTYYDYYFFYNSASASLSFTGSEISDNDFITDSSSTSTAYAYYFWYLSTASELLLDDSLVTGNVQESSNPSSAYAYYHIYNSSSTVEMTDTDWVGNTQAAYSDTSTAYAYYTAYNTSGTMTLNNVKWTDNLQYANGGSAYSYYGFYVSSSDMEWNNVIFANNTKQAEATGSSYGYYGFVYSTGSSATVNITNSDVVANTIDAKSTYVGFLYASSSTNTITNTNFVNNQVTGSSSSIYPYSNIYYGSSSTTLDFTYNNLYDNEGATADIYYGSAVDYVGTDGNVSVDPDYTDVTATDGYDWDLTLAATSSLIDAGDPSILDTDMSTSDIGAYGGPGASW